MELLKKKIFCASPCSRILHKEWTDVEQCGPSLMIMRCCGRKTWCGSCDAVIRIQRPYGINYLGIREVTIALKKGYFQNKRASIKICVPINLSPDRCRFSRKVLRILSRNNPNPRHQLWTKSHSMALTKQLSAEQFFTKNGTKAELSVIN